MFKYYWKPHSLRAVLRSLALLLLMTHVAASAQSYRSGQHVEPAFEGWRPNPDGTFSFMFGYMNENWEEEPTAPVGEDNFFSPGDADRGQPTHFLPRRNRFNFEVTVPADWGDRELVWTLNVNGVERKAYATLRQDYLVDNMVIASETGSLGAGTSSPESRANVPPVVMVQGDLVRTARVGEPIKLVTSVWDDGLPKRRRDSSNTAEELKRRMERPLLRLPSARSTASFSPGTCTVVRVMRLSTLHCQSPGKILEPRRIRLGAIFGSLQRSPKMASTKSK